MSHVWILHIACAAAYLCMASFILGRGARTRLNQGAAAINVAFLVWSGCLAVSHYPNVSKEMAARFYSIGSFAWAGFASVAAFFILAFLRPSLLRRRAVQAALVVPPAIVIFAQWSGWLAEGYLARPWGYAYMWREGFWSSFFFGYYGLYMTAGLGLVIRASFLPAQPIRRRQARIIGFTALVPLSLSSLTDVVLPRLGIYSVPNMAPDFTVIWVIALVYAIAKYRMLELTPAVAADRIVATMSEALLLTDPNGFVLLANPGAAALLGRPVRELEDAQLTDLFPERLRAEQMETALAGTEQPLEMVLRRSDGSEVAVLFSASPLLGSAGELLGLVCAASDLGKLKEAQDDLRRARDDLETRVVERTEALSREVAERKLSEERYRLLIETMQEGLWVLDAEDRTTLMNPSLLGVLGFGPGELDGRPLLERVADATTVEVALKQAHAGKTARGDWELRRKDGAHVDAIVHVAPLFEGESYSGAVLTVVDVTDRKQLQSQLARADRLASIGRLAAGVGHEVNNPLSWVLDNLSRVHGVLGQEALGDAERERVREQVAEALDGARRVRDIVKQLRAFSRGGDASVEPLAVSRCIDEAIKISEKEIRFRARLTREYGETPPVRASQGRLVQVFVNLLVNATHAIPEGNVEGNEIRVRTWHEAGQVFAEVRDTGHGIAEDALPRLFDPFFTTKENGEGLGLSICHEIVTQSGGTIGVESELGRGTTFTVVLPAQLDAQLDAPPDAPEPRNGTTLRAARVLVVDDEPALRRSLRRTLGRDNQVVLAESAEQAREILSRDDAFDLLLCDLMMPGMSGIELYELLLTDRPELARRMVFMTGGAFTPRAEEFLNAGERPVIAKPFESDELLAKLGEILVAR